MDSKLAVLTYQNHFADNLSTYAYGKVMSDKFSHSCVYENSTDKREKFENDMNNFKLDYSYISKPRADKILSKSKFLDVRELHTKDIKNDKIVNNSIFKIDDIEYINDTIKESFEFQNLDFIQNFDILEEINSQNSVGLYINSKDIPDISYIKKAYLRLNKYVKKPILYIFSTQPTPLDDEINYKTVELSDWREEFYFLERCKHKIIHCTQNSYSEGFWASILGNNNYSYVTYSKKLNNTKKLDRWLEV